MSDCYLHRSGRRVENKRTGVHVARYSASDQLDLNCEQEKKKSLCVHAIQVISLGLGFERVEGDQYINRMLSQISPDISRAALRIQQCWRGIISRRSTKSLIDMMHKRRKILEELVQTEENYILDLGMIAADFRVGLEKKKVITAQQSRILFSNIDQIRQLNEIFFAEIFNAISTYSHWKIIFEQVEKKICFFKIYFEYINNYQAASNLLRELDQDSPAFQQFTKSMFKTPKYRNLTISDFIIKPFQRLPKYVIIMREIKKRTPLNHRDLPNILNVLKGFETVNFSNNQLLNRVLNGVKLVQLERQLALPLTQPHYDFIFQDTVAILAPDSQILECTLYLLTTELIATQKNKGSERLVSRVPFNYGGTITENEDQFYYKNSFTLQNHEGDSCTFLCQDQEEKDMLLQKIYNQVMKAEKRAMEKVEQEDCEHLKKLILMDLMPEIVVLGTEERSDTMFKFTVYVVEIKIRNIRQKIFVRYREILEVQALICEMFPRLNIKQSLVKTTWLLNHQPIRIEERKMNIQRFLKQVLCKREIIEEGSKVLNRLGLPADLYDLPDKYKESLKRSVMSQRSTGSSAQANHGRQIQRKSTRGSLFQPCLLETPSYCSPTLNIQEILKVSEIRLGRYTRTSQILDISEEDKEITMKVIIPWISQKEGTRTILLHMNTNQRVSCLMHSLARSILLRYYKDFRLFLERDYAVRQLDDDELLPKVIQQMKAGNFRLILKKMIYIDAGIEERSLKEDPIRLKIVASQVIYETKRGKFLLDYNKFLSLSVLIGIIQAKEDPREEFLRDLPDTTRRLLANKYTSFYDGKMIWRRDYMLVYRSIQSKLSEISDENIRISRRFSCDKSQCLKSTRRTQSGQESQQIELLACMSIINEMKNDQFYGSVAFIVQISSSLKTAIREKTDNPSMDNRNCWLIVKYNTVSLFSICLDCKIFECQITDIVKTEPYPSSILLYVKNQSMDTIKLKATASYSIRELLSYYTNYGDIKYKMENEAHFVESMIDMARNLQEMSVREEEIRGPY